MKTENSDETNRKVIKLYCWGLMVLSVVIWFSHVFISNSFLGMVNLKYLTRMFDPPLEINFVLFFTANIIEFILCALIFFASIFVLEFKNKWRLFLIIILFLSIVFVLISPVLYDLVYPSNHVFSYGSPDSYPVNLPRKTIMIWSYIRSIILSTFFLIIIRKLRDKNTIILFR